ASTAGSEGQDGAGGPAAALQKVSREHHIGIGPGGAVVVAGGKYTTHRKMAEEIVDFTLAAWKLDARKGVTGAVPGGIGRPTTSRPVTPRATTAAVEKAEAEARKRELRVPLELYARYGAEALELLELGKPAPGIAPVTGAEDPAGFPML